VDFTAKYKLLNLTVQPRVVFFGTENLLAELFVLDKSFLFEDPLDAIETTYHLFHSTLDVEYPVAAINVWKLIGSLIFNSDEKKTLTSATIGTLNDIIK
jgi:hypothetical protein